jgi:hypothetical protein
MPGSGMTEGQQADATKELARLFCRPTTGGYVARNVLKTAIIEVVGTLDWPGLFSFLCSLSWSHFDCPSVALDVAFHTIASVSDAGTVRMGSPAELWCKTDKKMAVSDCALVVAQAATRPKNRSICSHYAACLVTWASENLVEMPRVVEDFDKQLLAEGFARNRHKLFFDVLRIGKLENLQLIVAIHDVTLSVMREYKKTIRGIAENRDPRVIKWAIERYDIDKSDLCSEEILFELGNHEVYDKDRYETLRYVLEKFDIRREDVKGGPKKTKALLTQLNMAASQDPETGGKWFTQRFSFYDEKTRSWQV